MTPKLINIPLRSKSSQGYCLTEEHEGIGSDNESLLVSLVAFRKCVIRDLS